MNAQAEDQTTPEAQAAYWQGAFERMAARNIDLDRALTEIFDRAMPDMPDDYAGGPVGWLFRQYRELRVMAGRAIGAHFASRSSDALRTIREGDAL